MAVRVRYIVTDIGEAIAFYTKHLGFVVGMIAAGGFAALQRGELQLLLNQPGTGGAGQSLPDGSTPTPGGWNRIQLEVEDLQSFVAGLRTAGVAFRSDIIKGRGGDQILVDDPSGNCIELFQSRR